MNGVTNDGRRGCDDSDLFSPTFGESLSERLLGGDDVNDHIYYYYY